MRNWSVRRGLNSLPPAWKAGALPNELLTHGRPCRMIITSWMRGMKLRAHYNVPSNPPCSFLLPFSFWLRHGLNALRSFGCDPTSGCPSWNRTSDQGVKVPCLDHLATGQYQERSFRPPQWRAIYQPCGLQSALRSRAQTIVHGFRKALVLQI